VLVGQVVVEKPLFSIDDAASVSALHQLLEQPLHHWKKRVVVKTLDLMGEDFVGRVHDSQAGYHLLCKLNLLTKFEIVFKFQVDVVVAASDAPAHTSEDLIEWLDGESGSEVAGGDQGIAYLLQKLLALIISFSFQHIYFLIK